LQIVQKFPTNILLYCSKTPSVRWWSRSVLNHLTVILFIIDIKGACPARLKSMHRCNFKFLHLFYCRSGNIITYHTTPCTNRLFAAVIAENNETLTISLTLSLTLILTLTLFLTLNLTLKLSVCYRQFNVSFVIFWSTRKCITSQYIFLLNKRCMLAKKFD